MGTYPISASENAEKVNEVITFHVKKNSRQKVIYESVIIRYYDEKTKK